jgi:hypothetical protein
MKFVRAIELHTSADLQPAITLARISIFYEVKSWWYFSLSSFRKHHKINFDDLSPWELGLSLPP